MSHIARAFTTRRVKMSIELAQEARERAAMQRSNTTKAPSSSTRSNQDQNAASRPKISGPVELIHTTNMLSYNAPDLPRPSTSSAASTKSSDAESETSTPTSDMSSPPTSPDVAPDEMDRFISPEPNHLSCYFQSSNNSKTMPATAGGSHHAVVSQAPAIPKRAPSHTKKASFEALGRQRSASTLSKESGHSLSTKASFSFSRSSSGSTTASSVGSPMQTQPYHQLNKMPSTTTMNPNATPRLAPGGDKHPFGHELALMKEIAEETNRTLDMDEEQRDSNRPVNNVAMQETVSSRPVNMDVDESDLLPRGLCKHSADAYLLEIELLLASFFKEREAPLAKTVLTNGWI